MSKFYAQITPQGLVVGVSELAAEVVAESLVPIAAYDESLIGKIWTGAEFVSNPDEQPPEPDDIGEALRLAQKALAVRELPDAIRFLDSAERGIASKLFPAWRAGMPVAVGEVYRYADSAWRVIQPHTTQADWTPPAVPALFESL